jgi:fluoride exporter
VDTSTPQPNAPIEDLAELPDSFRFGHPRISWLELAAVGAGGAVGALARVGAEQAWPVAAGGWPWAVLLVNLAGAFVLGCLMTALRHGPLSIMGYRLLGTGFCGALTTFSTLQLQLLEMLDHSRYGLALGYLGVSLAGGYVAVAVAERLIRRAVGAGAGAHASGAVAVEEAQG